jgi:hypothetical protein
MNFKGRGRLTDLKCRRQGNIKVGLRGAGKGWIRLDTECIQSKGAYVLSW